MDFLGIGTMEQNTCGLVVMSTGQARPKVFNAWNSYALREPNHPVFIDHGDLWDDAELGGVEAWLEARLRNRASKRRLNINDLDS